ncbi:Uncharacterized conserved protein [Legionella steigerwaltii]|uniref:Uncharacterized conserved protein n=1 Tax=Legionella steigerwaltii TaxID=460 RepID=A0A378L6T8_9GAMM|nr:hypothetical protein [Legionella steigerwaltii]KTD77057.1 hypothetical protein Lstg_2149 [Legionella steigerwaltii]STY21548.1 Uncharacterized conserved protein [Legionella steigerwaltii]
MYLPDLNQLVHYKNDKIISRYDKDYPSATMQAEDALEELMKFIWLCMKQKSEKYSNPGNDFLNFSCVIHPEMVDIDNMWHTFLLFTKDYHAFCSEYLGGIFFHHEPIINENDHVSDENYEQELTLYLSYIYDNLGEDTLRKWFGH